MSLTHSRRGRPVIACDWPGCRRRFATHAAGETIVQLRLRASLNGWSRFMGREYCWASMEAIRVQAKIAALRHQMRRGPRDRPRTGPRRAP